MISDVLLVLPLFAWRGLRGDIFKYFPANGYADDEPDDGSH
jgi:hypothetical protein